MTRRLGYLAQGVPTALPSGLLHELGDQLHGHGEAPVLPGSASEHGGAYPSIRVDHRAARVSRPISARIGVTARAIGKRPYASRTNVGTVLPRRPVMPGTADRPDTRG